jgi:hypothetical protein
VSFTLFEMINIHHQHAEAAFFLFGAFRFAAQL